MDERGEQKSVNRIEGLRNWGIEALIAQLTNQSPNAPISQCPNSVREIARVTGLSESNVGTIVHRAVQSLRQAW